MRRVNANRLNGVDAEWLEPEDVQRLCPIVNVSPDVRYPILGATYQPRGGIAKHDHIAWGYARAADALGVDLIQHCEVTGITVEDGRAIGVETVRGPIAAGQVAIVAAGHASVVAAMAGIRLPLQSHPLQALVSELLEPVHPNVVMSNTVHVYVSQAHKGELVMGAGIDPYNSYAQRGSPHVIEAQMAAAHRALPRVRAGPRDPDLGRDRGRVARRVADRRPQPGPRPVPQLRLGHGRVQGDPASGWVLAHTIANDEPHPLNAPVRAGTVHDRRLDRRARRRGGCALMCGTGRAGPGRRGHVRLRCHVRAGRRRGHARRHARAASAQRDRRPRCLRQPRKAPGEGFEQFEVETTTGPDGRFAFRFAPSDRLRRLAGADAPAVNFAITAFDPRQKLTWSWSFSREMGATGWRHETTPVRLVPSGVGS